VAHELDPSVPYCKRDFDARLQEIRDEQVDLTGKVDRLADELHEVQRRLERVKNGLPGFKKHLWQAITRVVAAEFPAEFIGAFYMLWAATAETTDRRVAALVALHGVIDTNRPLPFEERKVRVEELKRRFDVP
jgi:hypothetical protein